MLEIDIDKTTMFLLTCFIVLTIGLIVAAGKLDEKSDNCTENNGTLLKAVSGYVCVDNAVLKGKK